MAKAQYHLKQLPLNFPQTFLPDRDLLARLLRFVAQNGSGTKEQISTETGIPTGKSTGKVEPMIHYAYGMGLVTAQKSSGVWQLDLTSLGHTVLKHDAALSEPLTTWLLHLLLCRRLGLSSPATGLADAWFVLFAEGVFRLGKRFTQTDYVTVLHERYGDKACLKNLSGLVLRCYFESRAFGGSGVLREETGATERVYIRQMAPFQADYFPAYSAYLYLLWDELFSNQNQLAFDEFSEQTRLLALSGWDQVQATVWLDWMVSHGIVQSDRHTGGPVLLRLKGTSEVLGALYDGLV